MKANKILYPDSIITHTMIAFQWFLIIGFTITCLGAVFAQEKAAIITDNSKILKIGYNLEQKQDNICNSTKTLNNQFVERSFVATYYPSDLELVQTGNTFSGSWNYKFDNNSFANTYSGLIKFTLKNEKNTKSWDGETNIATIVEVEAKTTAGGDQPWKISQWNLVMHDADYLLSNTGQIQLTIRGKDKCENAKLRQINSCDPTSKEGEAYSSTSFRCAGEGSSIGVTMQGVKIIHTPIINPENHNISFSLSPTSSKNPALPGEEIECITQARDELGHELHYEWSALDSPLGFDDVHAKNPKWKVQPNTTEDIVYWPIKVKITCDHGAFLEGSFIQSIQKYEPKEMARVYFVKGIPLIKNWSGMIRELKKGDYVFVDDVIYTDENSYVSLVNIIPFNNSSYKFYVDIDEKSEVKIKQNLIWKDTESNKKKGFFGPIFYLFKGLIYSEVSLDPNYYDQFEVESDIVAIGVHGTSFSVKYDELSKTQSVSVVEGEITCNCKKDSILKWTIKTGEKLIIDEYCNTRITQLSDAEINQILNSTKLSKVEKLVKFTASNDSHIYQYTYSNWNRADWGAYDKLGAGYHPVGGEKRAFLKFDIEGVNPDEISKATLRLYHYHTGGNPTLDLGVYEITEPWAEGDGLYKPHSDATGDEVCWVNQPSIDHYPVVYFNPGPGTNKWIDVDITSLVKAWLSGVPNYGLVIKAGDNLSGKPDSQYGFYSREYAEADKRPQLLINPATLLGDVSDMGQPDITKADPDGPDQGNIDPDEPGKITIDPKTSGKVVTDPITTTNTNVSSSTPTPGTILWTHTVEDKWSIHSQTFGGDLGPRMALGLDGTIYYAGVAWGQATHIFAVNKTDGRLKWKSEALDGGGLRSHVMVGDDGTVYAIGYATLYALNPNTGSTKWTWSAPEKIDNIFTKYALAHMSLKKDGSLIVFPERGAAVYSLDVNGKMLWYNLQPQASPLQCTIGPDGTIYSLNNLYRPDFDGSLYLMARDPDKGTRKWVHKTARGIGGGNNIAFDAQGYLLASFIEPGDTQRRLHKIDPSSGEIVWSSTCIGGQHGLYVGPDNFAYQYLAPPGEKQGIYRINLTNSQIELVNWSLSFGAIDDKNRLLHNFTDVSDHNKKKFGALQVNGTVDWKVDMQGIDDRTMLISDGGVIYAAVGNNKIVAIQSDAPLASSGWPRLGSDNRNTFRALAGGVQ